MVKSGLIFGVVALLVVAGATLASPLCTPCGILLIGLGAGYVGGVFDKPRDNGGSAKSGAGAGAIAGAIGLLGGLIGAVVNAYFLAPSGNAALARTLGVSPSSPEAVWGGQLGLSCCIGLFNIAIAAGLGALGGLLWYAVSGKNRANVQTPLPPAM
jgi:hypothetical protein